MYVLYTDFCSTIILDNVLVVEIITANNFKMLNS